MLKTIKLTTEQANELCMALGIAGGWMAQHCSERAFTELTDNILVQLGPDNYTYGAKRVDVIARLKEQGIEVV